MKIVKVAMTAELRHASGPGYHAKLKDSLDGLNRLGLLYQVELPSDQRDPIRITATGQASKVEAALRLYGAVLTAHEQQEVPR